MSTSQLPEDSVILFLDRTPQSKDTAKFLRKLGVKVELHKDHFPHDSEGSSWIPVCAANGWAILTGDKGIEYLGINRAAVNASAAKVFVISDYRARGLEQTAALIAAHRKIGRITLENVGPFYCNIEMTGNSHVGNPRFQPGGYALQKEPIPESGVPVSKAESGREHDSPTEEKVPRTADFDFG